ncbi:MAG TPA: RNA methyltransferase [Pyrinomonadaceae bacterium]|nr:RNA methyltransferase [Pyrinomonadaceae bacterium]
MKTSKEQITSRDNARLKHARAVRAGRVDGEIFVEGLRLAEEAAQFLDITDFFYTPEFAETARGEELLKNSHNFNRAAVSQKLLESISDTKTPQGAVLLARKPKTGRQILEEKLKSISAPLFVVLHEINNPSNAGAILRTAEAAGAAGAILTRKSADVFSPKSLRGAMGAAFRLPLWTNADFNETINFFRANRIKTICADVRAEKKHTEIDWRAASALIVGSEARGLTPEEVGQIDEQTKIPMKAPVESLNAAVAAGIILYEAARQRNF